MRALRWLPFLSLSSRARGAVGTALLAIALPTFALAQNWSPVANISETMGVNGGRLCLGEASRGDLGCPTYAPSLTTAGDISVTGNLSAAKFIGDGSGLTGLSSSGDRITSGTTQAIAYNNTSLSLVTAGTERMVIGTNGEVGIGQQPATNGTVFSVSGTASFNSNVSAKFFRAASTNGGTGTSPAYSWNGDSSTGLFFPAAGTLAMTTSGTEAVRIVSSGLVGIGTSTPNRLLTLSYNNANTASSMLDIQQLGSGNAWMNFSLGTAGTSYPVGVDNSGSFMIGYNAAGPSGFSTPRIVLNTGGRVGIARLYPSSTLDVSGTIKMSDGGEACATTTLGAIKYAPSQFQVCKNTVTGWENLSTSSSNTTVAINTGLSGSIVFRDEYGALKANNTFSISSTTGAVGIGAGAPSGVGNNGLYSTGNIFGAGGVGTNGTFYFSANNSRITGDGTTSGNNFIGFVTSNTEAIRIVSTGLVGIGTTTPGYNLDVSGTFNAAIPNTSLQFSTNTTNQGFFHVQSSNGGPLISAKSAGVSYSSNRGVFNAMVDNLNGNQNSFFIGLVSGTATYSVRADGLGYFAKGISIGTATSTTALYVSGTTRTTTLQLADTPPDACTTATIKFANGRPYICVNR